MVVSILQSGWDWLNYWMGQSTENWHALRWAVDDNPLVIALHLIAGTMLALSFYTIAVLMSHAISKQGYTSRPQKFTAIFFLSFLTLCGTTFVAREITFFYPIFWFYGGIKFVAAFMATLTTVLYIKYYKRFLSEAPTVNKLTELELKATTAERKAGLISEHLDTWSKDVSAHIEVLKGQHKILVEDLKRKGIPVTSLEDIHVSDSNKDEVLKSLEIIKLELENLTEKLTNLDDMK